MHVHIDPSALGQTRWYEYAVRFVFGGLITAFASVIAKQFRPVVGGLFLAFPAIFPASATLIEKHEKQKAEQAGRPSEEAGRQAVAVDAEGSALGSIRLFAFALFVWQLIPRHSAWLVLLGATVVWLTVALLLWEMRTSHHSGAVEKQSVQSQKRTSRALSARGDNRN
jgi:hypothetical protein